MLASVGIKYNLRELPEEKVKEFTNPDYHFPKQKVQLCIAHDFVGYEFNSLFYWAGDDYTGIPIFWDPKRRPYTISNRLKNKPKPIELSITPVEEENPEYKLKRVQLK